MQNQVSTDRSGNRNLLFRIGLGVSAYLAYNLIKKKLRSFDYENKVAVITGGSRGLGLILARQLTLLGAKVAILARDGRELEAAKKNILSFNSKAEVFCQACDTTQETDVQDSMDLVIQHFGRIDVVINNAGVISVMPYENTMIEDFDEAMQTHFWGPLYVIRSALPHLKASRGGRIVNISSIGGKIAVPHLAPYCASKFALVGLSDSLRTELMKDNILVTTVCPGLMRTGSVGHGKFKGQQTKEYTWFAVSDSLPILSVNAERAATEILNAARAGKAELIISAPAKLATKFRALCPEICADLLALTNKFLPEPTANPSEAIHGYEMTTPLVPSVATTLSEVAADKNNEKPLS